MEEPRRLEPIGNFYRVELQDVSTTASGLVLTSESNPHVVAKILEVPSVRRINDYGVVPDLTAEVGDLVIVQKGSVVRVSMGKFSGEFIVDQSILAIVR